MNHSSEHTKMQYLNNIQKNKIKPKNRPLKLENDRKIEDNIIKDVKILFRLKKTQRNYRQYS